MLSSAQQPKGSFLSPGTLPRAFWERQTPRWVVQQLRGAHGTRRQGPSKLLGNTYLETQGPCELYVAADACAFHVNIFGTARSSTHCPTTIGHNHLLLHAEVCPAHC